MDYQYAEKIKEYVQTTGLSYKELAGKIGITASNLSQYVNKIYKSPETTDIKIEEFFRRQETAAEVPASVSETIKFAKTSIAEIVHNIISYCHIRREIGCIYGDAGIGKTMAIKEYCRHNSEAIRITIAPATSRQRCVLGMLCDELHIQKGSSDKMYLALKARLDGSEKVIIFDEAQHLTYATIENIRSLNDEGGVGMIFVGNYDVNAKLTKAGYEQLKNRVVMPKLLASTAVKREDIELIFPGMGKAEIDILYAIARSDWCIRGACHAYQNAVMNEDVSAAGLKAVARMMGIH